jgi:hypothetical protein
MPTIDAADENQRLAAPPFAKPCQSLSRNGLSLPKDSAESRATGNCVSMNSGIEYSVNADDKSFR